MLNPPFITGSYYHIFNRGVEKRKIFLQPKDYARFLETIDFYRFSPQPMKFSDYKRKPNKTSLLPIEQKELVEILCFCLMPNHFHLLIRQLEDGGITELLRKISDSYSKFFNTKYERVGGLFQGSFKARIIESDEYLLQVSKYIHLNPQGLEGFNIFNYPYSSLGCYLNAKDTSFCKSDLILSYFSKTNPSLTYEAFIKDLDLGGIESLIIQGITIDHL